MGEVVNLKERQEPHIGGTAMCMNCKHEWQAVLPQSCEWWNNAIECPKCHTERGVMKYNCAPGDEIWQCNCGSIHFVICNKDLMCVNCGKRHYPWEDQ